MELNRLLGRVIVAPRRANRHRSFATTLALVMVLGGGIALAFWTASGTGAGGATTGAAERVVLTPGTAAATLFPGGRGDVALRMSNPGAATVTVPTLVLDPTQGAGGFSVDAAHAGCDVSALALGPQDNAGAGWTVPGRVDGVDGTLDVTVTDAVTMAVDAADACQGAQFTVYLLAGP